MSLDQFQWRFHSRRTMMMVGSTKSLLTWVVGAEDGIRTRDPHLGKVMRYRCATSAWNDHSIAPDIEGSEPGAALTWPFSSPDRGRARLRRALGRLPIVRQDEDTAVQSRSFGAVADEYDRLRPGPSDEALDWLIPTGASDVLEVGAGTGILTRLLAERVAHVTAVEPDDRMRDVLARQRRTEWRCLPAMPSSSPSTRRRTTWSSPRRRGIGSTRSAPSPRWRGYCARVAVCPSCGAGPTALSTGCARCGPAASSSPPRTPPRWTPAGGGATW